jgi:Uma2 family endonuclease
MSAATTLLTIEQYREQYAGEPGWEYWFGEAVRKPVPTWLHGILQVILSDLLYKAGYYSASELDLRIDPNWEPRPDVAGALELEQPYPTKPIDVAIEILSDDKMGQLFRKCRHYVRIGIPQIFVFDPEARDAWEWSRETDSIERIQELRLGNGSVITLAGVWAELDRRIAKKPNG